ncbi:TonB-dependent receptor [Muricoccus aerilatus]|uniref:TonB-dependent receptor n=1 Tax=Muricoccus aerilatus TaxID=452982 RepID=UPI000A42A422|nr:TonB-dependent receptor [Roseomonas aerilata]
MLNRAQYPSDVISRGAVALTLPPDLAGFRGDIPPPRHRVQPGGGLRADGTFQGSVDYLHAFNQNRVGENETPTKGYDLVNARIGYTARLDDVRTANFSVVGTNLLDSDIRNVASFKKDEVLLPGRTVRLLATLTF